MRLRTPRQPASGTGIGVCGRWVSGRLEAGLAAPISVECYCDVPSVAGMTGCAGIWGRSWRRRRRGPRHVGEVEEIQQVRLHGIAVGQVRRRTDKAALDELEHRSVIHRVVPDVVLAHERRNDHVRQPEAKLRGEALRVAASLGSGAGPSGSQVAVQSCCGTRSPDNRLGTREEEYPDSPRWIEMSVVIPNDVGEVVGVLGNRRHVIERTAAFVVS